MLEFIAADNAALAVAANLTMVVGDLAYAGTGRELEFEPVWDVYGDLVEPLAANAPFMASVGNHEMVCAIVGEGFSGRCCMIV